ncbi:vanillate O-demethylase ferredoxin subunit [Stella humosa]|uniref:Vanillate O-demethylase ferredoxin subunit n=1 Tax=Stella humosa TaxID=94 RepID=A0A3N1L0M3_9PROT|nr:PDR/VanB family oxidoreductase [Stella humosa]ROP84579.1 vanillate O-demethylase ferredoxin subunit [Stella humosa]BBK34099.1 ferredoxin:oxidoreductase FAD/NAD(P)-binding subunit [Stella humosa]
MPRLPLAVAAVRRETADILAIDLAHPAGRSLPPAPAGAHIRVRVGDGPVRQYSLMNGPDDAEAYRIAVKLEPASRGGSAAMHRLTPGDTVLASLPVDGFPVDWRAGPLLLLAGGIGVTPLLGMARHAMARGHPFELHHFARSAEAAAFADTLQSGEFAGRASGHFGLDGAAVPARLAAILGRAAASGTHAYICGPAPFMDAARTAGLLALGADALHFEYFSAGEADAGTDRDLTVRLGLSGRTLAVPAGRSILSVLLENGVEVDCSCMEGVCGMCVTEVLAGEPDHRDHFLSEQARGAGDIMTVCVSRARGPELTLAL